MIKRPFFGLAKPKIEYDLSGAGSAPTEVAFPARATFLAEVPYENTEALQINVGDAVKAGQKIVPQAGSSAYAVSAVGGTVSEITSYIGNFGRKYTAITIDADAGAETDGGFKDVGSQPSLAVVKDYLQSIPGGLPEGLWAEDSQIKTIVVCGADDDLLCMTRASIIKNDVDALRKGVDVLKKICNGSMVVVTAPESMVSTARAAGAEVKGIGPAYPAANPYLVARDCLSTTIPAGSTFEAAGVCFISAEAVAALGKAFDAGAIPDRKVITVVSANGQKKLVSAVLGTPVGEVLTA
jgi:Na+-translocating ferredoxin:NAD+ oxidoreductase subunit C